MCTAGSLLGVADVVAQLSNPKLRRPIRPENETRSVLGGLDLQRTRRYASFGFWVLGSFQVAWYLQVAPRLVASSALRTMGLKVAVENLAVTVLLNSAYLVAIPLLALRPLEDALAHYDSHIERTVRAAWGFWPFVSAFNYLMLPAKLQPLFASFASLFWQSFLNLSTNRTRTY